MSKPGIENRQKAWPLAVMAVLIVGVVIAATGFPFWERYRFAGEWKPQISVSVLDQGTLGYGWAPDFELIPSAWGKSYSTYLIWRSPKETRRFRINEGGDSLGKNIRIYQGLEGQGIWIVDARDGKFLAALEFSTARFWDINYLPGFNDERSGTVIQKKPGWATVPSSAQIYPTQKQ